MERIISNAKSKVISSMKEEQKIAIGAGWSVLLRHIMEEKVVGNVLSLSLPVVSPQL